VLSAVDCAVMLIDAAKGLEAQTMKLFEVCAHRNIPIITVVNKWDRPGLDALELMDEVQQRTGLLPTPDHLARRPVRRLPRRPRPGHRRVHEVHAHRWRCDHRR
jgi:translation elongation factor EF-G